MRLVIGREEDGRWFGDVPSLPGVMAYGHTEAEAVANTRALAFRVLADRLEHNEPIPAEAETLLVTA